MSDLTQHVDDYLRLRRSFGFKLEWPGHLLHQLDAYREAAGATTLTAALITPGPAAAGCTTAPLGSPPRSGT
jgi:hypothetical protein